MTAPTEITFLSWNLAMLERSAEAPVSWEQYNTEESIRQQVLSIAPDIVLFQELPGIVPFIETHDMVKANPQSHSGHLATLVSHELMQGPIEHLAIPGCGLLTTFKSFGLTVANIHLSPGKGETKTRRDQLSAIIRGCPNEHLAIIGDTNTRNSEIKQIRDAGLFAPTLPKPTWDSFRNRFHLGSPRFRANFTRCFTHPSIQVADLKVIDSPVTQESKTFHLSDHFALYGTLVVSKN